MTQVTTKDLPIGGQPKLPTVKKGEVKIRVTLSSKGNGMLMNPMSYEKLSELSGVSVVQPPIKRVPFEEQAEKKVIRNNEGRIGFPIEYLLAALIKAGQHIKNGKGKISSAKTTTLYEFLSTEEEFLVFKNQAEKSWKVDIRKGKLKVDCKLKKVRIVRPLFRSWETTLDIVVDTTVISMQTVKQLFDFAGNDVGVGDFRTVANKPPSPFGKFVVSEWELL
jgi:hypothetical protein